MENNNKLISKIEKEEATSFTKNVMMLAVAQIVVKVLGLVYKIVIVNIPGFGNVGSGYYSTGYQLYMVLLAISSIGIPNVVSKLVSERVAIGDYKGAHKIFSVAFKMFTLIGFILALFMFLFAKPLSVVLFGAPGVAYTLMSLAPAVMFVSSNSVLRGYFTGLGSLKSTSISEIVEQFFNCLLSISFVYMAIGTDTAVMAAAGNISTSVAALISLGYMLSHYMLRKKYINYKCDSQESYSQNSSTRNLIKTITMLAVPASFASLVSSLSGNIDSVTVNLYTGNVEAYGIMSKTETITHMPLALGATLFIAMVPVISALIQKEDYKGAQDNLTNTMFLSILLMLPCAMGLTVLAEPILMLLYPTVSDGALLLQLQTIAMIFAAITFVLNGVFYGLGKQKYPAIILLIGAFIKLVLNIVFLKVMNYGAVSAVISTIIYQFIVMVVEIYYLNKFVPVRLNLLNHLLKPTISMLIMGLTVYITYTLTVKDLGNTVSTLLSIIIGVIVYFAMLIVLRALSKEDYENLPLGAKIYNIMHKFKLA